MHIEAQIDNVASQLSDMHDEDSAESAHGAKAAVVRPILENKVEPAKATDQVSGSDGVPASSSRRLVRPPAFETSSVPNGSVVSSK